MKVNYIIIYFLGSFLFAQCSLPEPKSVKYQRDGNLVIEDLKELGKFKEAGVSSGANSFNGKVTYSLNITLLNGRKVPDNEKDLKEIAFKAMNLVINSMENERDYDTFSVEIIDDFNVGIASKTTTKSFSFTKQEIIEMQSEKPPVENGV